MSEKGTAVEAIQKISEAQLVRLSVSGDRSAFEEIVRRNVSPVAAVAYALTGDAATSEDVTQEVFLKAWQRLRELREPEKLRSWLCAIARNVAYALGRKSSTDPLRSAGTIEETHSVPALAPSPAECAMAAEQQRLVWAAIEQIPENYRVPLVLYYREGHSAAEVATALDLTEEAARQRLSRARAMLKEEVAKMVETSISATRPSPLLVTAIIAGIAGGTLHATAATSTIAAAAKMSAGGAAGGTALSGAVFGSVLGPIIGIGGGIAGCMASLRAAKTPAERKVVIRMIWSTWILVCTLAVAVLFLVYAGRHHLLTLHQGLAAGGLVIVAYIATLVSLIVVYNRKLAILTRQRTPAIRILTPVERHLEFVKKLPHEGKYNIIGGYAGAVYGPISWILVESALQRQPGVFMCALAAGTVVAGMAMVFSFRHPQNYLFHMAMALFGVLSINMAAGAYWAHAGRKLLVNYVGLPGHWMQTSPMMPVLFSALIFPVVFVMISYHRKMKRLVREAQASGDAR